MRRTVPHGAAGFHRVPSGSRNRSSAKVPRRLRSRHRTYPTTGPGAVSRRSGDREEHHAPRPERSVRSAHHRSAPPPCWSPPHSASCRRRHGPGATQPVSASDSVVVASPPTPRRTVTADDGGRAVLAAATSESSPQVLPPSGRRTVLRRPARTGRRRSHVLAHHRGRRHGPPDDGLTFAHGVLSAPRPTRAPPPCGSPRRPRSAPRSTGCAGPSCPLPPPASAWSCRPHRPPPRRTGRTPGSVPTAGSTRIRWRGARRLPHARTVDDRPVRQHGGGRRGRRGPCERRRRPGRPRRRDRHGDLHRCGVADRPGVGRRHRDHVPGAGDRRTGGDRSRGRRHHRSSGRAGPGRWSVERPLRRGHPPASSPGPGPMPPCRSAGPWRSSRSARPWSDCAGRVGRGTAPEPGGRPETPAFRRAGRVRDAGVTARRPRSRETPSSSAASRHDTGVSARRRRLGTTPASRHDAGVSRRPRTGRPKGARLRAPEYGQPMDGTAPTPYLLLPGTARTALARWQQVFGGDVRVTSYEEAAREDGPPGAVAHGELVGPVRLFAADTGPDDTALAVSGSAVRPARERPARGAPAVVRGPGLRRHGGRRPPGAAVGRLGRNGARRVRVTWLIGFERSALDDQD